MADEKIVEPSKEDNSTTPPQEEKAEEGVPQEDNTPVDNQEEDAEKLKLKEKIEKQAQMLTASKAEALRLKSELEARLKEKEEPKEDLIPVSPEDVAAFKALGKAAGIVFKEENEQTRYQEKMEMAKDKFLKEHPEYNKPGDPDSDEAWEKIVKETSLYKSPANPEAWYDLLKKAHKDVNNNDDIQLEKGKSLGMAQANLRDTANLGGGGSGGASTPTKKQTPEQKAVAEEFKKVLKNKSYYKE